MITQVINIIYFYPLSSKGKDFMKFLQEILIKNEWFTRQEVEELFTSEIQKCINECTRPNQSDIFREIHEKCIRK